MNASLRLAAASALLGAFVLSVGCKSEDAGAGKAAAGAPSGSAPVVEVKPAASGAAKPDTTAAAAADKPALPPGRTPAPTLEEWSSMRKEVTVKGSSALNCETKIVREYLRIACRGKNDSGGTPTNVKVLKGGRGEVFTFASGGITTLVMPYVSGADMEAEFSWTDKTHKLAVKWPKGAPMPPMVGVFEGAQSPLGAAASNASGASADKLCACHKKVFKADTCADLFGAPNADCERTYGSDCQKLLECSRGEPSAMPTCLPGYVNAGIGYCYKLCSATNPCPTGSSCYDELGRTPVCIDD